MNIIKPPVLLPAGEDKVILIYHCHEKLKFEKDEISGDFHVYAVYVKVKYDWKLFLWQNMPFVGKGIA